MPTTARRLGDGIDQTRATLAQLEASLAAGGDTSGIPAALRDERRKLLALDEAYQAEFARIESTLRSAGLTEVQLNEKLAIWHGFTAHYRQRMDASLAGFDRLSRGGASQREIASLRAGLGEPAHAPIRHVPPPVTPALFQAPSPDTQTAADQAAAATDPPTPDELAATSVVQISPDIRALAATLGNSPAAIYAYVHDNIRFVPYLLAMQNSEGVLLAGRGNDADQATLLIALLRAAGIPARYVTAPVTIDTAAVVNWLGAKDKAGALKILNPAATARGATDLGNQLQFAYTWVEAWVDQGNGTGPSWIALAPSFKQQTFQPGLQVPIPTFDRLGFLSTPTTRLATDVYADQIHAALAQTFPGHDFSELGYTGTIVPATTGQLPQNLPFTAGAMTRVAALPSTSEWKATLTLFDSAKTYLSGTFFLPDISLQSLSLSFTAATPVDQTIIDKFGGIAHVPAGMVNLLAQFRLDDTVVATSTVPVPLLKSLQMTVAITRPNDTVPWVTATHPIVYAGTNSAIAILGAQLSDAWVGSRIDGLLAGIPTASMDTVTRETLFLAGLLRRQQLQNAWAEVYIPLQYDLDFIFRIPTETYTVVGLAVQALFDRPFLATGTGYAMDGGISPPVTFNLNAPGGQAADINPTQAAFVTSSQSECQTWERLALVGASCTVAVFQQAGQDGIPILTITPANAAAILPNLAWLPAPELSMINSELKAGDTVTIPAGPVTIDDWTGTSWIYDIPNNGGSGWIDNQLNGGFSSGKPKPRPVTSNPGVTGNPTPVNGTTCSDPVTVSNGNMFQEETDLAISSRGPSFVLTRTYNSFFAVNNGPFGFGWTHSYMTHLTDNGSSVSLVNGSGGSYTFALQGGAYFSPAGLDLKLTKDAQGYTLRSKHGTQSRFDINGVLQSITDRNQNALKLAYDTSARLTTLTDSLNRVVTLAYDASSHIVSARDFSGRQVVYTYDGGGNLATVTDFAGNRTAYAYYKDFVFTHLLQTVTKPAGNSTSFEYYANRQTARISDSAGRNMRFLYLPFSNQSIFIDARGFASSYYYDALGEVTRVVKTDGTYIDTAFTADAKVASMTDEDGAVTQFTYDALGNVTSATDSLGRTVKLVYEPNFNMVTSVTDALGKVTNFEYDAHGNLVHVIRPLGVEARIVYDGFGEATSATDAEGNTAHIAYDSSGNPITVTDPLGNVTQLKFDALKRPIAATDALGETGSLQFDALDRLTQATDPLGNSASAAFDANGNLAQTTDPNGRTTRFSYDTLDNLAQVTDAKSGTTQYGYSVPGCGCNSGSDLITHQSAAGETRALAYDFNHWLTQSTDAAGASTGFVYNGRGDILQRTDANGNTVKFEYDAVHRLVHKIFPDGSDQRFSYDANGNLTAATNANTSIALGYDDLNRLTSVTDSRFGKTIRYGYNRNGLRTSLTDSEGGVTSYVYDAASNLNAVTNPSGGSVQFAYDALNRPSTLAYSNGIGASAAYDAAGRVISISYSGVQSGSTAARARKKRDAGSALAQFNYTYDPNGNRTSITDLTGTHSYQFDELNRLTAAAHPTLNAESYSYDGAGNRTASASDPNYSYDRLGRLIVAEGVAYSYDANGKLTTRTDSNGTTVYTYDYENQLTGIMFPDGTTAAYLYDAFGRRIGKNVNGTVTNYLYDGVHILLEMDAGGAMQARYAFGAGVDYPLTMERGGQTYFYHADAMGSIAAVTDSSGNTACGYLYDSFGRTQPCQSVATPFGFAGREYDAESGLYYMRARYYDPATGRFLSSDPLDLTGRLLTGGTGAMGDPQQLNRYSYAVNNPLSFRDPSGLRGCAAFHGWTALGPDNGFGNPDLHWWSEDGQLWEYMRTANSEFKTVPLSGITDPQTGAPLLAYYQGHAFVASGYTVTLTAVDSQGSWATYSIKTVGGADVTSFTQYKTLAARADVPATTWANDLETGTQAVAGLGKDAAGFIYQTTVNAGVSVGIFDPKYRR